MKSIKHVSGKKIRNPLDQRPRLGPVVPFDFPLPVSFELKKGIRGLHWERHDLPLVDLRFMFRGGVAHETSDAPGVTYATSQMLDEGAGARSALEISSDLLQIGALYSAWVDSDATSISLQVLRKNLDLGLDILADIILRPRFASADWQRVKGELYGRALERRSRPSQVAQLAFKTSIYGLHPYSRPSLPLPAYIQNLKVGAFKQRHRQNYRPDRAMLVVAGAVSVEELSEKIEERFGSWRSEEAKNFTPHFRIKRVGPRLVLIHREGATQSALRVGHLGPSRSTKDYGGLRVLNTILGGSFTSRLNLNLREKHGFTYGVRSFFVLPEHQGMFGVRTSVDTKDTVAAIREIFHELEKLRASPVSSKELAKAQQLVLEDLPAAAETLDGVVEAYSDLILHRQPVDSWRRLPQEVTTLDPDKLLSLAQNYLKPDHATIVVVGNLEQLAEPLQQQFGKAVFLDADSQPCPRPTFV